MASATKKYYYVLVLTESGSKFVTSTEYRTAHWDSTEKPLAMSQTMANDMSIGLMWNGHLAYPVVTTYEITAQPFQYDKGEFQWVWKKDLDNKAD